MGMSETKQYPNHNHASSDVKTAFRLLHTLHYTAPCLMPFVAQEKKKKCVLSNTYGNVFLFSWLMPGKH